MYEYPLAPWWLSSNKSTYQAGTWVQAPEMGRFPGKGNGNSLQYSCLGNPMDGGLQSMESQRVRHDLATQQQQNSNKKGKIIK